MCVCRFTNCLVYYALSLSAGNLGENKFISFSLSGLAELPSIALVYFVVDRSVINYMIVFRAVGESEYSMVVNWLVLLHCVLIACCFVLLVVYTTG